MKQINECDIMNAVSDECNVVWDGNSWVLCVVNIVRSKSTTENSGMNRGNEPRKVIAACCNDEYGVLFVDERIDVGFRNKI